MTPYFTSIATYNEAIQIPPPARKDFDVRRFEDNMPLVNTFMPPFRHNFYQVALLEEGTGTFKSNGQRNMLGQPALFFVIPGQVIQWNIPRDWKGFYVSFGEDFTIPSTTALALPQEYRFFASDTIKFCSLGDEPLAQLTSLFEQMRQEYRGSQSPDVLRAFLRLLLLYSHRHYCEQEFSREQIISQAPLTRKFEMVLGEDFKGIQLGLVLSPKSVADYADQLHVSPKYLSEMLKRETGLTTLEHIHQKIVFLAKVMLATTDMPVVEVSRLLGFQNQSYFNRLFRKYTHQTPSAFRVRQ
ncbi:AraC family transcriptional regulator [Tunicatimonas pelagia]|uniref:AraC family transcriptional regulator n=1 Tax=Tunicatimonas pelagia TaxID=931531 RepID=UPI0026664C66|nr:AraC family transcriptional regulator [Tunicatimonas pelagia]WKN44841.1 AraC family transcriptional regulator [Tunicatimonas pelagia]